MRTDVLTALTADVDAIVELPLTRLSIGDLQTLCACVAPLSHRLTGLLSSVTGELDARGGGPRAGR